MLAALLRELSRRIRLRAEPTRAKSRLIRGDSVRLVDTAREAQIERYLCARRWLAGGSGPVDDALPTFALAIAREVTPALTTIRLRLEAMLDEIQGGEPQADLAGDLETLRRRVEQTTAMVKALTALGGESGFEPQPIDLNGVVEHLLPAIAPGPTGPIVVRPNLDPHIPAVLADADCLRYAVTSLIESVGERSSTVDIVTRRETNGMVRVDVGASRTPGTVREITLQADPLSLILASRSCEVLGAPWSSASQTRGGLSP